ncbi:MAG: cob(I)yrinic acid a,c-diamide adenosyltransferase [Planctomycetota bacterium]|nr:MAG: cob(I)yrinic acid a,c-diamide adenosyltransferase [Planctomycetota bacterium]
MVRLDRIYTKTGDDGTTGLGDGTRLPKHHLRVEAYGTVDELSSCVGLAVAEGVPDSFDPLLRSIQNDLFDVGADLCVPGEAGTKLRITPTYTERLERAIDEHNARLKRLESFVLPGGEPAAARLHVARTVCRRAERVCTALTELEGAARVNAEVVKYLNRLSDLLFVLARVANHDGKLDVLWQPGKTRGA